MREKILDLLKEINDLKNHISEDNKLPANTFYLNNDNILCMNENHADIRYPYEMDGMNLWAHSNGYIDACEGRLSIIKTAYFNENSYIDFWGGVKSENNEWFPLSILGTNKQLYEPEKVERYTVFEKRAAYYIADCEKVIFAVRANVTAKKQINFTVTAINKTSENKEIYISSFIDFSFIIIKSGIFLSSWNGMSKFGKLHENGTYTIRTDLDIDYIAVINKKIKSKNKPQVESTTSKLVFVGSTGNNIANAQSLKTGCFDKKVTSTTTSDEAVVGDIIKIKLNAYECAVVSYLITIVNDDAQVNKLINNEIDLDYIECDIRKQEENEKNKFSALSMNFHDFKIPSINKNIFNRFLRNVQKQVDLCALGKNYVGALIGVRDVFQQLDTSIMWNPKDSRAKIIYALNYIFSNGRSPRQFSAETRENTMPAMDTREFIDQGVWIIETVYNYLAFTDDYTILNEKCSYYDMIDEGWQKWTKGETTTVLEHLIRIMKYLISNIDSDTNCLKILYGDWNDAINGLGKTDDKDKKFGNGVSVMATLQLYRNLQEMTEILSELNGYEKECKNYQNIRKNIHDGLLKYALTDSHIIHGWGDKQKYKICTPSDYDSKTRYSSTPYSFWCIAGMIEDTPELKESILKAYDILDSKYGIRTCFPHFEPKAAKYVGRVANITPGTYENCCAYVHSSMFAAMALFMLGEGERAWEQIEKAIPITHSYITKTPFVMPNSYCYNPDYNLDGESMGDWYTGSGCVLIRNIVKYAFGIQPDLGGIKIKPSRYMPTTSANIKLKIKNCTFELIYRNNKTNARKFYVNDIEQPAAVDKISGILQIYLENGILNENIIIKIVD